MAGDPQWLVQGLARGGIEQQQLITNPAWPQEANPSAMATDIAVEHALWAMAAGLLPGDVLSAIDVTWPTDTVSTEIVVRTLAKRWIDVHKLTTPQDSRTYPALGGWQYG